jgi:hypothetical protein
MTKYKVTVEVEYTVGIDENNPFVKGYQDRNELLQDCIDSNFGLNIDMVNSGGVVLMGDYYSLSKVEKIEE